MRGRWKVGLLAIAMLAALVLPALPANADHGTFMAITSNTTLTEDLHGSVVISADAVTLDCAGHKVLGPGDPDGIVIDGFDDVVVKNCWVEGFERYGIRVASGTAPVLTDNVVVYNGSSGIYVGNAPGAVLRFNFAEQNAGHGFEFEGGTSGHEVLGNHSLYNFSGFYITAVTDSWFASNVASYNHGTNGFTLDSGVNGNTFEGNGGAFNAWNALDIIASHDNTFISSVGFYNGDSGIALTGSNCNTVQGSQTGDNANAGIRLEGSARNTIASNLAISGNFHGIILNFDSDNNVVRSNDVFFNDSTGVAVAEGSDWNLLKDNHSRNNGDVGFHIFTEHNSTLSNRATDNGAEGFRLSGPGARANKLALNTACGNGGLDALEDPDVGPGNVWKGNSFCTQDT